ncbi:hypothetical protein [Streptomyces sp. NPDC086010]|uniref:hypothetical protein n=1 Tax=Streptomyces sp. NPDC086010 TaxID=3365745 RepID=UPI0037D2EF79
MPSAQSVPLGRVRSVSRRKASAARSVLPLRAAASTSAHTPMVPTSRWPWPMTPANAYSASP